MPRRAPALLLVAALACTLVAVGSPGTATAAPPTPVANVPVCVSVDRVATDLTVESGTSPTLALPQFDPALGQFLSAEFTGSLSAELWDAVQVFARPAGRQFAVNVRHGAYASLGLPSGETLEMMPELSFTRTVTSLGTTPQPYGGADSFQETNFTTAASATVTSTDESVWVGTSTIDLRLTAYSEVTIRGAGGNMRANQSTHVSGSVCARYFYVPALVSVGDYVWFDADRDGQQGATENPVADVTVELLNAAGEVISTTTTSATGFYSFTGLSSDSDYTVRFIAPPGSFLTAANLGADDGLDSDAPADSGEVAFHTPLTGVNDPVTPDVPTIDAGVVRYNLLLAKALETDEPYAPGSLVTFTLSPSNEGPADALAGWTVTDLLPTGLEFVAARSESAQYTFDGPVATSSALLAAGATAPEIIITARISADVPPGTTLTNIAWIAPATGDGAETNPLGGIPSPGVNTTQSATDNDSEASLITVAPVVDPVDPPDPIDPGPTDPGSVDPGPVDPGPTDPPILNEPPAPVDVTPPAEVTPPVAEVSPTAPARLAYTGVDAAGAFGLGLVALLLGFGLVVASGIIRRDRRRRS